MKFHRAIVPTLLAIACAPSLGCSGASGVPEGAADDSAIVGIPQSPVTRQSVGNCIVHATVAWVESLARAEHATFPNVSEAYLTYWLWLDYVRQGETDLDGGFVTGVYDHIAQRGMLDEATFGVPPSDLERAQKEISRSLTSGPLQQPEARNDIAVVRRVFDEAFRLSPEAKSLMTRLFGADFARTLPQRDGVPKDQRLLRAHEIPLGAIDGKEVTLADAIGERRIVGAQDHEEHRAGALAWKPAGDSSESVEVWRDHFQDIKAALHAGLPIPFGWTVDRDFEASTDGAFRVRQRTGSPPVEVHASLITDYEAKLASGEVVPAGRKVDDAAKREALLRRDTQIVFIRAKNSWGKTHLVTGNPVGTGDHVGYTDIYWEYLFPGGNSAKRMFDLVVPAKPWLRLTHRR